MQSLRIDRFPKILLLLLSLLLLPQSSFAQEKDQLQLGRVLQGSTGMEGNAEYTLEVADAGILTVAVRSTNDADLVLLVTDHAGQPLPEARSDQDLSSDPGAEQLAVTLPRAGAYRIRVETFGGGSATFKIGASWLPFPDLELAPDPDGAPDTATPLQVGQGPHMDSIDGSVGDPWDWFVFRPDIEGTLTVATQSDGGDLILEAFDEGEFTESSARSDQDLQGNSGNEAVTLVVKPGEAYYFKVSAWSEGTHIEYQIQVGIISN
jgi:hypothetical protein